MKEVSVVVVTYNSPFEKLENTLQSVIWQENVDFEIIIADDGSKSFDKERVESWFNSKDFKDYKLVLNKENQGTLKNFISGWKAATGKYVKELSPGDLLYDKTTLEKSVRYMEDHNVGFVFGLAASYKKENDSIELLNIMNPGDLRPYYSDSTEWKKLNYVVNRDYANGMAVIERRDLMLKYSSYLEEKVKFMEDCIFILMIADDVPVGFIKDYMIWYEFGGGISTRKDSASSKRVVDDNIACFKVIGEMKKKYRFASKTIITNNDNLFIKIIKKANRKMHYLIMRSFIKGIDSNVTVPKFTPEIKHLEEIVQK